MPAEAGRPDRAARSLARTPVGQRLLEPLTVPMVHHGGMAADLPPDQRPRCTATSVMTGERCKRRPHPGSNTCVKHGSGAPQVRAAAARRVADAQAVELASRMEIVVPEFASAGEVGNYLLGQVTRRAAQFAALADQLGTATYTDRAGQERTRAVITEQRRWLEAMSKLLGVASAAAAEARGPSPVQLFTMAADLFRQDVDAALADAGVYGDQHEAIMARLADRTRLRVKLSATLILDQVRMMAEAAQ